jgi:hypothetical protein
METNGLPKTRVAVERSVPFLRTHRSLTKKLSLVWTLQLAQCTGRAGPRLSWLIFLWHAFKFFLVWDSFASIFMNAPSLYPRTDAPLLLYLTVAAVVIVLIKYHVILKNFSWKTFIFKSLSTREISEFTYKKSWHGRNILFVMFFSTIQFFSQNFCFHSDKKRKNRLLLPNAWQIPLPF